MASLRVLLVERDPSECERISDLLESAQHDVLPLHALSEAAEALDLQRFDAVLVPPDSGHDELAVLAAKVRLLERNSRQETHIPILARGTAVSNNGNTSAIEAYLPCPFEAVAFSETVCRLAHRTAPVQAQPDTSGPVFEISEFADQLCGDEELMAEIIDLYLEESLKQRSEMRMLLEQGDLPKLSRVAHTIKGSLGSLHAPRARQRAQELELAGKAEDSAASGPAFAALDAELTALEPELLRFRSSLALPRA